MPDADPTLDDDNQSDSEDEYEIEEIIEEIEIEDDEDADDTEKTNDKLHSQHLSISEGKINNNSPPTMLVSYYKSFIVYS